VGGWLSTGRAARWAFFVLCLVGGLRIAAQPAGPPSPPDDATAAEAQGQVNNLAQAADSGQLEDMGLPDDPSSTDGLPQTNGLAASGDRSAGVNRFDDAGRAGSTNRFMGSSRGQNDDRRSRGRRSRSRSGASGSASDYSAGSDRTQPDAAAGTNTGPASLDYAAFKVIVDKNIFDPNRVPHRPGVASIRKPRSFDSLTLVGTMTYEKGTFAFFDGTSSEYKKALKLTDAIAGYKVTNIAPNGVKLASGTNEVDLGVGAQLRREEGGPWLLAGQGGPYADTPAATSATTAAPAATAASEAAPSGPDSDILKKLMERRQKE
jgi:hypothetical protein